MASAVAYNVQGSVPKMPPTPPSRGYTGASLSSSQRPTTAERLTPMPDYMHPVTRSSAKRFKKLHEDHMMEKLMIKRSAKKERNIKTRDEARALARKIPLELLAKEWFNEHEGTVETRAFLVDKIMPTLILGVEKLLLEVERRNLADTDEPNPDFNPINFLAQYLMRNNPKYSNFSEASPYVRGLRSVTEELRMQLFDLEENRLARIKADAKRKREEREQEEEMREMEKKRRTDMLTTQFSEWHSGPQGVDPRVHLALLQNALRSFQEVAECFPEPQKSNARYCKELDETDDTGRDIAQREFILYVWSFVEEMASDMFDHFVRHMAHCAHTHTSQTDRIQREAILEYLFKQCDHTGVGLLDRHRMLNLFKMFFDKAPEEVKDDLRNPRKWPMVDIDELDSYYDSDDESEDTKHTSATDYTDEQPVSDVVEVTSQALSEPKDSETAKQDEQEAPNVEGQETTESEPEPETTEEQKPGEEEPKTETEQQEDENTELTEAKEQVAQETEAEKKPETEDENAEQQNQDGGETEGGATDTEPEVKEQAAGESEVRPVGMEEQGEAPTGGQEVASESAVEGDEKAESSEEGKKDGASLVEDENALGSQPLDPPATANVEGDPELAKLMSAKTSVISARPPMTQQSKVSFAEGTTFERERQLLTSHGTGSKSQASTFDENTLNQNQFSQLTETFLGDEPHMDIFQFLVRYVRDGYVETEEERMNRLLKARGELKSAKRKAVLNSIFEMWDNEGSGYLDLDEVVGVMKKYKEGVENLHIDKAKKDAKERSSYHDNRLSKREFREFVYNVVAEMVGGGGDVFDYFMEFLLNSVERSYQERVRGEARKKWLQQIIDAGETSAAHMEPVYKSVFQALYKDAEAHGQGKMISSYVALLERNDVAQDRGDFLLRYSGATLDHAHKILNKALFKDMKGVSFACVDTGKPIHVPRVASHGNIYFWDPNKPGDDSDGSLIVVPLKDRRKRVFGILGIDTLNDLGSRVIFITHEIQFFQGVAKAFSIAYHHVDVRLKTMRISESAISWIHRRSPNVHEITIYMMEPDGKGQDYVLRRMMSTDDKGMAIVKKVPDRLERKDNLFRDYLFKCVDNSESVTADAYGERHLAIPLRDDEGRAIVVVDISIGSMKQLPKAENREVVKMLRLLQLAYREISRESREGEKNNVLEGEQNVDDDTRTEILFDKLMLIELRDNVSRLDASAYAELKSYKEPPPVVHQIIKAVLAIFYPQIAKEDEFENWDKCKKYVNPSLGGKIMAFDPTSSEADIVSAEYVNKQLADVPHGTVSKHGSFPAQFLYNWVFVCVSLIEHTRKMQANRQQIVDEMNSDEKRASPAKENTNVVEDKTKTAEDTVQDTVQPEPVKR